MSDNKENPPKDSSSNKLRTARLRLEGGGVLSQLEQDEIDDMNARIALLCANYTKSISLTMQALSEMLFSAIAFQSKDEKEFRKNIYNFMKDYWFPQSEKIATIIMAKKEENDKLTLEEKLAKLYKITNVDTELLQPAMVLTGSPKEIIEKLNHIIDDTCPCPKCVERRKLAKIEKNTPNPNTKH